MPSTVISARSGGNERYPAMSVAPSIGVSYPHTMPSWVWSPTSADQYDASPLNGHVVWNDVAVSRSVRTSAGGR